MAKDLGPQFGIDRLAVQYLVAGIHEIKAAAPDFELTLDDDDPDIHGWAPRHLRLTWYSPIYTIEVGDLVDVIFLCDPSDTKVFFDCMLSGGRPRKAAERFTTPN